MIFGTAGLFNKPVRLSFKKYVNIYKFSFALVITNILLLVLTYGMKDASVIYKIIVSVLLIIAPLYFIKRKFQLKTIFKFNNSN